MSLPKVEIVKYMYTVECNWCNVLDAVGGIEKQVHTQVMGGLKGQNFNFVFIG